MTTTEALRGTTRSFLQQLADLGSHGDRLIALAVAPAGHPESVALHWSRRFAAGLHYRLGRTVLTDLVPDDGGALQEAVEQLLARRDVILAASLLPDRGISETYVIYNRPLLQALALDQDAIAARVQREVRVAWYTHRYLLPFGDAPAERGPDAIRGAHSAVELHDLLVEDIATHLMRADEHLGVIVASPAEPAAATAWLLDDFVRALGVSDPAGAGLRTFTPRTFRTRLMEQLRADQYPVAIGYWIAPGGAQIVADSVLLESWGFQADTAVETARAAFQETLAAAAGAARTRSRQRGARQASGRS